MEEQYLEEEIEMLEYACNNISSVIDILNNSSSEKYRMLISQCQELLNDIDYILIDDEERLDTYNHQQLNESRLERHKRETEFKKELDF